MLPFRSYAEISGKYRTSIYMEALWNAADLVPCDFPRVKLLIERRGRDYGERKVTADNDTERDVCKVFLK